MQPKFSHESITPPTNPFLKHGGQLDAARQRFFQAPEPWIDLSTGISPFAFSVSAVEPSDWRHLPNPQALQRLEATAARHYGIEGVDKILAVAGIQSFLQILPMLIPVRKVGIVTPSYSEYSKVWSVAGIYPKTAPHWAQLSECDLIMLARPNNPDGRLWDKNELVDLAKFQKDKGAFLIIDEAFMDVFPKAESMTYLANSSLIILRSFGKAYGLGGIRLGFVVSSCENIAHWRQHCGPWPINGPAIRIGLEAFSHPEWLSKITKRLERASQKLQGVLLQFGFQIIGQTPLFVLAEHQDAAKIFNDLASAGILIRPFADQTHWLRFGIPSKNWQWQRLKRALQS